MAREFKDAKDAKDAKRDEGSTQVLVVRNTEANIIRQDGDDVDDAHHAAHVLQTIWRRVEAQEVFGREDHDASRIEAKEYVVVIVTDRDRLRRTLQYAPRRCLDDVSQHRDGYEEAGHVIKHQRNGSSLRVFESAPHALAERRLRIPVYLLLLVIHQTFIVLSLAILQNNYTSL